MKTLKECHAVAEILGSILLIAMAISAFSIIYINVLSDSGPPPESYATIVGKLESGDVVFEHRRGESLGLDTKVIISIGGKDYIMNLKDDTLLDIEKKIDGFWNIGEKLVFSEMDTTGLQVETTIIDKESNSVVMWGILQEGNIITTPGAIWHFDENGGDIAFDSLNNNHGHLCPNSTFGPTWDEESKISGPSALRFDGINDYVKVKGNSVSLDITDTITLESWIKFPEGNVLHKFNYSEAFGYEPNIIQVSNKVYAVAYRDQQEQGILKSVKIFQDGTMSIDIHNNTLVFESGKSYRPRITHVSDDIFMVAYAQSNANPKHVYLKTIKMLNNGTIVSVLDEYTYGNKEIYDHELIKISDNISLMVYRKNQNGVGGEIKTIMMSNNGTNITTNYENGTFEFESSICYEPNVIHVAGETYAIVYRGQNDYGYIKTVQIAANGTIYKQVNDSLIFDTINDSYEPFIAHVAGDTYAIAYRDSNKFGYITTLEISEDGLISDNILETCLFESDSCHGPDIVHMFDDTFLIAYYDDVKQDGYVEVIKIAPNGSISQVSNFKINTYKNYHCETPDIIHIYEDVFAIAFKTGSQTGPPHQGHLITGRLSEYDDSNYSYPSSNRIIYKEDTYGIYANKTHLSINIHNHKITEEIALPSDWNHIVLTYDGSTIILYCNGAQLISESYDGGIPHNINDIYFGKLFFGYIDEIAIYDRVLTLAEIQNHYNNPGII